MPGFDGIEANPPAPLPESVTAPTQIVSGTPADPTTPSVWQDQAFVGAAEGVRRGLLGRPTEPFRVYVGGPIDFNRNNRADWMRNRNDLVSRLRSMQFEVFAAHEDTQPHEQAEDHAVAMEYALRHADAMVAFLPPNVVTYGTPIEIYRARDFDIPVMVVGLVRDTASPLLHGGSVTLNRLGVEYADSYDAPVEWLVSLRNTTGSRARVEIDNDNARTYNATSTAAFDKHVWIGPIASPDSEPLPVVPDAGYDWAMPKRHYDDDAGLDLFVTESTVIRPGEFVDVPAGVRTALPAGTFGLVIGRSSAIRKRGVLVVPGVIDVGWRGHLFVGAYNVGDRMLTIQAGDRLGQLLILPNLTANYNPAAATELPPHPRGERGFGSTGGITIDTPTSRFWPDAPTIGEAH